MAKCIPIKELAVSYLVSHGFDFVTACEIFESIVRPGLAAGQQDFHGRGFSFGIRGYTNG